MSATKNQFHTLWLEIKETVKLNIDYAKLTGAEKLTIMLSTAGLAIVAFVLLSTMIFFISLGLLLLLSKSTGLFGASMIMAGIYAVMFVVIVLSRKQLIINPIARFISKLFLNQN